MLTDAAGMAAMSFNSYLIVATNVTEAAQLPQGRVLRITDTHVVAVSCKPLPGPLTYADAC